MRNTITTLLIICVFGLIACHHGRYRTVTIVSKGNGESVKIKYMGEVKFSADTNSIQSISPGGYLVYRNNNKSLEVESNEQGQLSIEMKDDGKSLTLDTAGKEFMAAAIRDMLAKGMDSTPEDGLTQ